MSGIGGNLTQPMKKVLLNAPGPNDLGTFRIVSQAMQILQFKTHGYSLPMTQGAVVRVTQHQPAIRKATMVELSSVAPVDPSRHNYGIKVTVRHRKPGQHNDRYLPRQIAYGAVMRVTSPVITNAELNVMRNNLVAMINNDNGQARKFVHAYPGAGVIAGIGLRLNAWNAASAMTLDGNAVAAAANIALFVANINALPGYFAAVDPASPTNTIIVFRTNRTNTALVFASTGGTIANANAQGLIGLFQRYDDLTFSIEARPEVGVHTVLRNGRFALLTNDDVQQQFSHIPNDGMLAQESRHSNLVLPGVNYVKLKFEIPQPHYDLQGASHTGGFMNAVEVYIPAAEWNINVGQAINRRWEALVGNRIMDAGTASNLRDVFAAAGITIA